MLHFALMAMAMTHPCSNTTTLDQATSGASLEIQDRFGEALARGDFDDDGFDDLVIGSPWEDLDGVANTGNVTIHYGTSTGLGSTRWSRFSQSSINGSSNEAGDLFGDVMDTGDFDGDGYADLVIGIPKDDQGALVDSGRVAVKYGSAAGLTSSNPSGSFSQSTVAGNGSQSDDLFGAAVAVGDYDGDGYDDVAISAPNDDIGAIAGSGRIVVVYGGPSGLDTSTSEAFNQDGVGLTNEAGDDFGAALAAGDFDNDGRDDLAIGIPGEDHSSLTNPGQIAIKYGDAAGLKAGTHEYFAFGVTTAFNKDHDELGQELATGDIDGDGYADLVVGVPSKEVNGDDNAGLVIVMLGSSAGLLPEDSRTLLSSTAGEPVAFGVNFGGGVLVTDLDDDGYDDVVAGVPRFSGSEGHIAVFFGNATASLNQDTQWFDESCFGAVPSNDEYFGQVFASGDFDGDGRLELAAGNYNEDRGGVDASGVVYTADVSP